MNILFTGASSFTGYWFVRQLAERGHRVTALFRRDLAHYEGVRRQRVDALVRICRPVFGCAFGGEVFFRTLEQDVAWDLLCHHAADVNDYKSPNFDCVAAVANNTHGIRQLFEALGNKSCQKVVITGSVFEQGEGAGSTPLWAFSPYGLSKSLTSQIFEYYAFQHAFSLGKFVIPNPFGPYEESRFTSYLMNNWLEGKTARVRTPCYVRDNIHASLLAKAYAYFCESLPQAPSFAKFNPSGYIETQQAFTERFAREMRPRLAMPCEVTFDPQKEFPEPVCRINTDPVGLLPLDWDEAAAWDGVAAYYKKSYAPGRLK